MKNLQVVNIQEFDCPVLAECNLVSIDNDTDTLYAASTDHIYTFTCKHNMELLCEASLRDEGYLGDESSIISIHYVVDQFSLCIATSRGELLLWNPNSDPSLEGVGKLNEEIIEMSWSPDYELVVLVTGNNSVYLMSRDFDAINESLLQSSQFGEAELVSVGWGKKGTQFHGSEGKAAAMNKSEELTAILEWDDKRPRVTWRGDNQFYAVHFVDLLTNSRKFKIWTREGHLHATCTPTNGLAQAICFKTQGNLLASSVFKQKEHKVVFFEKNGLQHGEFVLPLPSEHSKVKQLAWNLDSTVLAVFCEIEKDNLVTQIQLWTTSNFHWYLKQCLEFSGSERVTCFLWDQESPLKLHMTTRSGKYLMYKWTFSIHKNSDVCEENDANVAVVDGTQVLVTPFARCVVPPPMSAFKLQFPSFVSAVMFGHDELVNDVVVLCIDGSLHWFSRLPPPADQNGILSNNFGSASLSADALGGNGFRVQCPLLHLRARARFARGCPIQDHHFNWVREDILIACTQVNGSQQIQVFQVCWKSGVVTEKGNTEIPHGRHVIATDFNTLRKISLVELDDGSCYKFEHDAISLSPWLNNSGRSISFPRPCSKVSFLDYNDRELLLGLTDQFRFFINTHEVAQDCTSYAIHRNFILLTTHSHVLRSFCLKNNFENDLSLNSGETSRSLERGSKLVCVVPRDTKVILQMPRGNLEVVHPRSLLIETIQDFIDSVKYKEAFELCRKHRVNMNILVDHNKQLFFQHVSSVVEQLETTHDINLLLNDLKNEDLTKTMYASFYTRTNSFQDSHSYKTSKVDNVCQVLHNEMKIKDYKRYFLSILMTFLKRSTPDLQGALLEVNCLKGEDQNSTKSKDDALRFLMYMVDVNELFDVAMGTYDLRLIILVAEKSQKDPKEYLAYLNNLKSMPIDLMKYTIDMKLKRFSKALVHISKCGDEHFDECMKLVVDEKLYYEALDIYPAISTQYKQIALAYGDDLCQHKKFDEAGMMYFKAEEFRKALNMFEESKNWRSALCCASKLEFPDVEIVKLANKLAGHLIDGHLYGDAAYLLEVYVNNYEEAIMSLISGHLWNEALRIVFKYKRMDMLEADIKPAMLSSTESYFGLIGRMQDEFIMHRDRLVEVRRLKLGSQSDLIAASADTRENSDLFSDTSSNTDRESVASSVTTDSKSSRKTGRSSKSRQKLAKKKWSLRKGGPTEEFALVEVLHKLATLVHNWKYEIGQLLRPLVMFNYEKQAKYLQKKLGEIIEVVDQSIPIVWTARPYVMTNEIDMLYGPHTTSNSIVQSKAVDNNTLPLYSDPVLTTPPVFDKKDRTWQLDTLND